MFAILFEINTWHSAFRVRTTKSRGDPMCIDKPEIGAARARYALRQAQHAFLSEAM
jgi:hypothetical protein